MISRANVGIRLKKKNRESVNLNTAMIKQKEWLCERGVNPFGVSPRLQQHVQRFGQTPFSSLLSFFSFFPLSL